MTLIPSATPTIGFTTAASLSDAKAIVVHSRWNTNAGTGRWTVLSPSTATSVTPPALPAALPAKGPAADATFQSPPLAVAVDVTSLPSYDAARAAAAIFTVSDDLVTGYHTGLGFPALPVDGTLRLSAIGLFPPASSEL